MRTPRTDKVLETCWTLEEKLEDMTSLCREMEVAIRDFAGDIKAKTRHPDALLELIRLAKDWPQDGESWDEMRARLHYEHLRDNRTCRHAMNPAFPDPNAKGDSLAQAD